MKKLAVLLVIVAVLYGCATPHKIFLDSRDEAYRYSLRVYSQLEQKEVNRSVIVKLRVFFTSKNLGNDSRGRRIIGFATNNNTIVVNATMLDGKIVVNEWVLGHELGHILNNNDELIADPDEPPLRRH